MLIEDTEKTPRKVLLQLLELTATNFQKLKQAGVFQAEGHGAYDLKRSIAAWLQFHLDGAKPGDLTEARRLLVIAQERKTQLDIKERERELVPLQEAQAIFDKTMVLIGAQLDGLAGRMAMELAGITDPAAVRAALFDETRRIRDEAARQLSNWAAGAPGSAAAGSTTTEDG
ncbi:MAG: hypothetical protein ACK2U9_00680 [Anaerolineae bacterium]